MVLSHLIKTILFYGLYLIQFKLYGCLSSKHGNDDLDHVAIGVKFFNHTDEPVKITVDDFDRVANLEVDFDLFFLHTKGSYCLLYTSPSPRDRG